VDSLLRNRALVFGSLLGSLLWAGAGPHANLSPDGKTPYVGESDTREIWSYRIEGTRLLSPRLVTRFADFDIDGLRTDISANLYVARILKGTIAVLSPTGKLQREIGLKAKEPTNLAFGGNDGKTVFVTQRQVDLSKRADRPGREFCFSGCVGPK